MIIALSLIGCGSGTPVEPTGSDQPTPTATPTPTHTGEGPEALCGATQEVMDARCVSCHGGATPFGDLSLEDVEALVETPSLQGELRLVEPYDPDASYLVHKLRGTQEVGGAMPPTGLPGLRPGDLETVEAWISAGALCEAADADTDTDADTDADADTDTDTDADTDTDTDTDVPVPVDLCEDVQDVVDARCLACHGANGSGGLDLRVMTGLVGQAAVGAFMPLVSESGNPADSYVWRKLTDTHTEIGGAGGPMPPGPSLPAGELGAFETWLRAGTVCQPLPGDTGDTGMDTGAPPPLDGKVETLALRRLNRAEYDNTVRDLLGTDQRPAQGFPIDDAVDGFDNNGAALTLSPLHIEMYESAAEALADAFVETYPVGGPIEVVLQAEGPDVTPSVGGSSGSAWNLWTNGTITGSGEVPVTATYSFGARVWGHQAGPDPVRIALEVDGLQVATFDVTNADPANPQLYAHEVELTGGVHTLAVRFLNDFVDPDTGADRNLLVDALVLSGPTAIPTQDPVFQRYEDGILCDPDALDTATCLHAFFDPFMQDAFRRPLQPGESDRLVDLLTGLVTQHGLTYREAFLGGMQATLLSPHFLFRPELDQNGADPSDHLLDDYEIASRLSYFLWSSMPDQALLDRAAAGELTDPAVVEAEARRMLDDPRAWALVHDFAGQWLWLRRIDEGAPDPSLYPQVDDALRDDLRTEAEQLVYDVLTTSRSMGELLTTPLVHVTPATALFYGYTDPVDASGEVVDLTGYERYGILTNAGLLASLSNPTTSNPVRRGKWVLNQLLCDEPGDPPPGVVGSFDPQSGSGSLRERFEQHRSDPICASCHDKMDPLGFSLESYGPAGELRTTDDLGYPVDATGTLPDGRTFDGPHGLGTTLASDPLYARCVSEKAYTYALGTTLSLDNYPFVLDARDHFVSEGMVFEELVVAIVRSDAFLMRGE